MAAGDSSRKREVQRCQSQLVSSDSMISLVPVVFFTVVFLSISRPDSGKCHERDGRSRLLLQRFRRSPLASPQIETSGLGHCLLEARRRAEGCLPRQRHGNANCASSRAHGACGAGGEHPHCRGLRGQSGCPVPVTTHFTSKRHPRK